jgi:hypothetical protein
MVVDRRLEGVDKVTETVRMWVTPRLLCNASLALRPNWG